jgi:capsular exopolysaccharide synthesis family protein
MTIQKSSVVLEAFRTVQSKLRFSGNGKLPKTILITSALPREGKSTIAANLAVTLAKGGKRVLLIDADLRHPVLHKTFKVPDTVGLTDYIYGRAAARDAKLVLDPNLVFIPAGAQDLDPVSILSSEEIKRFIVETAKLYDIVLCDSPPVLAVADATILSSLLDGVILVINSDGVTRDEARKTKAILEQAGAKLLGTILNNFNEQGAAPHYGVDYK